jgi:hypothetical protein
VESVDGRKSFRSSQERRPSNSSGYILAITTENNKEKIRLTRDLAARLKSLISANQLDDMVNVVVLKNHQAERIIPVIAMYTNKTSVARQQQNRIEVEPKLFNAWNRIKLRIRGHFYVYGQSKRDKKSRISTS